jgi:hypothetical protein
VSPAREQAACPLCGELGMLKAPVLLEAEEDNCWDQKAHLVLCACHQQLDNID